MAKAETKIVHKIIEHLEEKFFGIYLRKIHGNPFQHAGIPDIIGCYKKFFIALEVKTDTGKTSLIQQLEGSIILEAEGIYGVVRTKEQALSVIKTALGERHETELHTRPGDASKVVEMEQRTRS